MIGAGPRIPSLNQRSMSATFLPGSGEPSWNSRSSLAALRSSMVWRPAFRRGTSKLLSPATITASGFGGACSLSPATSKLPIMPCSMCGFPSRPRDVAEHHVGARLELAGDGHPPARAQHRHATHVSGHVLAGPLVVAVGQIAPELRERGARRQSSECELMHLLAGIRELDRGDATLQPSLAARTSTRVPGFVEQAQQDRRRHRFRMLTTRGTRPVRLRMS